MFDTFSAAHIRQLCEQAAIRSGASNAVAASLAEATCQAEARKKSVVGVTHLFDYLDALQSGRIDGHAQPAVRRLAPSIVVADAKAGIAHRAFDVAYPDLLTAARETGTGFLSVYSSYTVGELGLYVRRIANEGLFAVAGANSPALMSFSGSRKPLLGTNPHAFAFPISGRSPVVIDQASSQAAYVKIRSAAEAGTEIPQNWATDSEGNSTTDAEAAIHGALLPFGGYKGANIALLIELLSSIAGSNWSYDAPPFDRGSHTPGVGMFVLTLDPERFDTSFAQRVANHFSKLAEEEGVDLSNYNDKTDHSGRFVLDNHVYTELRARSGL